MERAHAVSSTGRRLKWHETALLQGSVVALVKSQLNGTCNVANVPIFIPTVSQPTSSLHLFKCYIFTVDKSPGRSVFSIVGQNQTSSIAWTLNRAINKYHLCFPSQNVQDKLYEQTER